MIRTGFDARDALVADEPHGFTVPDHLSRHMMAVADLLTGQPTDIEAAVCAAGAPAIRGLSRPARRGT